MNKSLTKQSGHAAILFALFIPVLFGVFTLGSDGARAIQDKARLLEAVEVASLAAAGHGSDDVKLAKSYIQYYFPSAKVEDKDVTIKKLNCEDNVNCRNQEKRFFEYRVSANITQPTWFPGNESIIGFGENYQVSDISTTRKYHAKTVDVIFSADFSGSMTGVWDGAYKYKKLIEIIKEVNDELEFYNNDLKSIYSDKNKLMNRSGFTAYDSHLYRTDGKNRCKIDHYVTSEMKTVDNIFVDKSCSYNLPLEKFYSLSITKNFVEDINNIISKFSPLNGTTYSYQGIIEAAYMAYKESNPNPRQLIIILSDGADTNKLRMKNLVNSYGMCSKIISTLESRESEEYDGSTESVKARMVMIGFGYPVASNEGLTNCVGTDNVFEANNFSAIKNKILELITEEIGHLAQ